MNALYLLRRLTIPCYRIKGIGLGRFCEMLRRLVARNVSNKPLLIDDFRGQAKLICHLREHMGGQIFFRGSYSGDQLSLLESLLEIDSVFVDAGANQGEFSVAAAIVAQQGKVIAFEPVTEYRERLTANLQLNGYKHVQVIPVALGEANGNLPIYDQQEDFYDGTRHEGLPTLFASSTRGIAREIVEVRRLDDVLDRLAISRVDVIKLDIEGAEWIALRGAMNTLVKFHPILILEIGRETCQAAGYESEAFFQWIIDQGYRIEKIGDGGKSQAMKLSQLGDFQNIVAYPLV